MSEAFIEHEKSSENISNDSSKETFIEHEKSSENILSDSNREIIEDSDLPDLVSVNAELEENSNKDDESEINVSVPEWVDLLGSGAIMKKIISEGKPDTRPQRNQKCVINYSCYLEDETLVETISNLELNLGESDVIQGLDVALGLMNMNEKCRLKIEPRLAFGKKGLLTKIPEDAVVIYEVELIGIGPEDDIDTMSLAERKMKGNKKRERGNWWYTRGDTNIAVQCYRRALDYLDEVEGGDQNKDEISDADLQSVLEDRISVYNNMAAAQIKMEMFTAALNSLQIVLRCQPNNVKAHFRKAMAYKGQNDLPTALRCLQTAKKLAPLDSVIDKEIKMLSKLILRQKQSEKELAKRMFNGTINPDGNEKRKKGPGGKKIILWATLGAAVAVGAAGVIAYRMKLTKLFL